jgi:hypothetical protein
VPTSAAKSSPALRRARRSECLRWNRQSSRWARGINLSAGRAYVSRSTTFDNPVVSRMRRDRYRRRL